MTTKEVGEDSPLPAPPRLLRHAVDGLLDAQHRVGAGGVGRVEARRVAGAHRAVHDLVVEQLTREDTRREGSREALGGGEVPVFELLFFRNSSYSNTPLAALGLPRKWR